MNSQTNVGAVDSFCRGFEAQANILEPTPVLGDLLPA